MFKFTWTDENAVSPVIATILMVDITVVLAGVLVVYMQEFSQGPGTQPPQATAVVFPASNSGDGIITNNSGGWTVKIQSMQGLKPSLANVKVSLTKNGVPLAAMDGVRTSTSTLWSINGSAGSPKWYLLKGVNSTNAVRFSDSGTAKPLASNIGDLSVGEYETIEGAYFVVVDNDGNGLLNTGDITFVYGSNDGDTGRDVGGGGFALEFWLGSGQICAANLG